jgi:hypothetical protein
VNGTDSCEVVHAGPFPMPMRLLLMRMPICSPARMLLIMRQRRAKLQSVSYVWRMAATMPPIPFSAVAASVVIALCVQRFIVSKLADVRLCGRTVTRVDYPTVLLDLVEHNVPVRSAVQNSLAQGRVLPVTELRDQFCIIIGCRFARSVRRSTVFGSRSCRALGGISKLAWKMPMTLCPIGSSTSSISLHH